MNKTEKEEIKTMLDEYWNQDDDSIDTVEIANRIMRTLGRMVGYRLKNKN